MGADVHKATQDRQHSILFYSDGVILVEDEWKCSDLFPWKPNWGLLCIMENIHAMDHAVFKKKWVAR